MTGIDGRRRDGEMRELIGPNRRAAAHEPGV
jgi:hypothetical protein